MALLHANGIRVGRDPSRLHHCLVRAIQSNTDKRSHACVVEVLDRRWMLSADDIVVQIQDSGPTPPPGAIIATIQSYPQTAVTIPDVPTSKWTYGCTATSAGMIFGYYDRTGYANMYTGPTNGGVAPLTDLGQGIDPAHPIAGSTSLIATQRGFDGLATNGHADDYWV